jgi:hypothetical protein
MDARLATLTRAVESGIRGPPLRVLVAGGAFSGTLAPSSAFYQAMQQGSTTEALNARGSGLKRLLRGKDELSTSEVEANAERLLAPLREQVEDEGAVTLAGVKWWSYDNRTTLEMPAVRIPHTAICGWWISGESGEQASDWYLGLLMPLPSH